jgi:hypothetical protein
MIAVAVTGLIVTLAPFLKRFRFQIRTLCWCTLWVALLTTAWMRVGTASLDASPPVVEIETDWGCILVDPPPPPDWAR